MPRTQVSLNEGWRYSAGPLQEAQREDFDDSRWLPVDLPHTWNASDAFDKRSEYRRGEGWYRRALALDPALRGRRLFVYFEGANQSAELFVNEVAAGTHVGGYTAFVFEVTGLVRFDTPNLLAVRVDNRHDPDVPPLEADFTFYGGVYRDVWLLATDPVHVDVLDHASPGVFVDTPQASTQRAVVRVRAAVANDSSRRRRLQVVSRVLEADGREVAVLRSRLRIAPGARRAVTMSSAPIASPRLWSPADPQRYRLQTDIEEGGALLDRVELWFGIREMRIDPERGLLLNGKPLRLDGTNRHQDRAGRGNALTDAEHRRDVALVKQAGFNFLRLAHYPQDPAVLDAADEQGLAVWEEIPAVNLIGTSERFADNAERMLVEMIRQHYNHPSILFWGYMNEVMQFRPKPEPDGYVDTLLLLARRLEARTRMEDGARATATAISFGEIDNGSGFQDIPQALGLNLYFGWYYRDLESLGPWLDDFHARHPGRPLIISEYGAGSDERVHARDPVAFDFSAEFQQRFHESSYAQMAERPWLLGSAVWNQFDFGSSGRNDTLYGINQKGLQRFDRTPKDVLHYYRARLLEAPVLHIAARDHARRAGSRAEDADQQVKVYSNLDEVELLHDGVSQGRARTRNAVAGFRVRLHDGVNRLEARGVRGGRQVGDRFTVEYEDRAGLFAGSAAAVDRILVNAGAAYAVTASGDEVWEADRAHAPGGWGFLGGRTERTHHRIFSTDDDPLWQASRVGADGYRFDVVDGVYDLDLGFIEIEHDTAAARVFDIAVNGRIVSEGLDLAATAGRYVPHTVSTRVQAEQGAGVVIRLTPQAGETTISMIGLRRRSQ